MAKKASAPIQKKEGTKKVTSIGKSTRTRINNKSQKRNQKRKYRGQGK